MTVPVAPYVSGGRKPLQGRRFAQIPNVILLETVPSTNDLAKELIEYLVKEGESIEPTAIVARAQTAGRGRLGRLWVNPPGGALTLSLVVPWPEGPERVRVPVAMGVALAEGLSGSFDLEVKLKWPNDLIAGRKKLGGILVEARALPDEEGFAVVGIGINLGGTRAELDAAGLPDATSLLALGVPDDALSGEAPLLSILEVLDDALADPPDSLSEVFTGVSAHSVGDALTLTRGDGTVSGTYLGVTADGLLRLGTASGEETVVSGEILEF